MDGPRCELLARSRFADDEDVGAAARRARQLVQERLERRAGAQELDRRFRSALRELADDARLSVEQRCVEEGPYAREQLRGGARLEQVVVGSETHQPQRDLCRIHDAHHGDRDPPAGMACFHHEITPGAVRQAIVGDDRIDLGARHDFQRVLQPGERNRDTARLPDELGRDGQEVVVVVDDRHSQGAFDLHAPHHSRSVAAGWCPRVRAPERQVVESCDQASG